MIILGFEKVDYISKKTNKQVLGTRLHMSYTSDKIDGQGVESVFVSNLLCEGLSIGDEIELLYNKYGNVAEIKLKNMF